MGGVAGGADCAGGNVVIGGVEGRNGFVSPAGEVTESWEEPAEASAAVELLPRCAFAMAMQPNTTTIPNAPIRSKRTLIANPRPEGYVPVKRRRMAVQSGGFVPKTDVEGKINFRRPLSYGGSEKLRRSGNRTLDERVVRPMEYPPYPAEHQGNWLMT
jgi:hypothetical protein